MNTVRGLNKQHIAAFFDGRAANWDRETVYREPIIQEILDRAEIRGGVDVLDVACGTGVLFADYLKRKVASVTAIDLSAEMARLARAKFPAVRVICGDAEEEAFPQNYDVIMVFDAFPHFADPVRLIENLSAHLKSGGRLCIAHDMSRDELNRHHCCIAQDVSSELPKADELSALLSAYLTVDTVISDEEKYIVSGIKKDS